MTTFDFLFSDVMAQRLGWVLVHFVWQGAAIAILLASLLAFMKNASSSAKYTVACGGLLLMACAPVVTMMLVEVETAYVFEAAPMVESTYEPMEFADTTAPEPIVYEQIAEPLVIDLPAVPLKDRLIAQLEGSLGYIVMAWALGVFALSLWHLGGWTQVTRLRKRMVKPVEGKLKAKMLQLASAIGVDRGVELLESALVAVPTVVGWLRPVILLPASAITGLSTQQLEAILAHELAHIKRCDWLVNVFQVVIETLGFYHPAVWWVSNRIRAERENCCDDVAVSVTGDRLQYARALTEMEELRHNGVFAIAATGSSLFDRIRRLLGKDSTQAGLNGWAVGAMLAMVIIAIAMPVAFAMSSGTASDTEADIEGEVLEGIAANRDKFECGILAWNRKYTNTAYDGPRGNRSGQYELWWDGKKMATKYVHDQVHVSPEGNWSVERRQGGKSYDGGLLSKKPKFRPDENWLLLSGWRGEGSQDWWILRLSSMENITTSWSVVDTNGVKLIKLEPRFINDSEMEKNGNYSIFYYDPSKGYRLVKQEGYRPDGSLHTVRTVKLREVIPDGWFPVEIDSKSFAREDMQVRIRTHSELDVERCSFNERAALPDRIFKLSEDKQFKYQQKLQEYLAMQLNGSNIKEAAMDDEVKLGAREAVEMFIAAAMAGDFETGRQFADPDKAPYNQIEDIPEMAKDQHLWIMAVLANGSSAIAVSSVIQGDHERVGPLVFTLDRVSKDGQDNWWINDIDLESPDRAEVELKRFMEDHPKAQMVSYQNKPTDADGSGEIRFGEKIGVEVEANSDVSAADLVRSVRASENWVHHVDSLYLRLDRKYAGLSDEAFTEAMKQYDAATGQQMKVPGMGMPGMIANLPNKEGSTNLVEIAIDTDRLRSFTQGNGSTDLRIWDGKQMSSHYKRDEFDTNLYVLKDNPQRSFKHMMLHMEWFRSQPHVFWWNGENEVWPMSYFGNADEFEIVGQENYRGIDCYVLCGDLATSGLSWKWYVGKKDKLLYGKTRLRHGKPDVESWMLDYKEVAPGCLIPMTQGRQSYKWNEAGTSYYISGPYDLKVVQVRVNEKLDDSLFEMEFVEGVNVQDKRGGMMLEYPYSAERVDRPLEFRKSVLSATNMKYIGRALFNYAMDHDDKFPSKLDELVEKADIHPKTFESPRKPEDFDGPSYIYIAGQAGTSNPNNVIVYENPEYLQKNSDKINVLYCDGHVEAVTADNLINQLRATYKRLDRDVSAVDNLRWADAVEKTDGNESDSEKIEMLINAVRQAQQPSHTMRISWEEVIPPSAMGVIAGPMSDELMKNGLPWVKCKYKATVSGIRSRIECIQEQYRDLQKEPFAISKETTVFDGLKCRSLQEFILSPDKSITGSQGLKDQNYPTIADSFFGTYFYFKDSNIISKYNPRIIDCDKEGCFVLEVSAPDHIQHFEIDSNKGFNVTKSTVYNGNMLIIKESVIEFGKTASNIWMPEKRVLTRYMRGKLTSRSEIKYDIAEFDVDVSDEIFTLEYPDGVRVWDSDIDGWIVIGDQDVPTIEEDVIQERLLSASRLKQLGQAAMLFAEDNDKKLPDKLDDMKPYLPTDEVIEWARENVDYLGAGSRQENILMAYDKTMLETNGSGTMVVYVNGRVEFIGNKMLGQFGVFGSGGEIRLRVLDTDGSPVAGAKVGTSLRMRDKPVLGSKLNWSMRGVGDKFTGDNGEIVLMADKMFLPSWPLDRDAAVYVMDTERMLGAFCKLSRPLTGQVVEVVLQSVCHVHGKLASSGLEKIGKPLTWTNVYCGWNEYRGVGHPSKEQRFEFLIPAGSYEFQLYGSGDGADTKSVMQTVTVPKGRTDLDLGVIDLPATKVASLVGQDAPELGKITEWKNGDPVTLSQLKGKAVILNFEGRWPGTSRVLPILTELYEQFGSRRLEIISIYKCDTMAELEANWDKTFKKYGGVWRVPFRIAIDGGKRVYYPNTEIVKGGENYDIYDIEKTPTIVLIDPAGKIVGEVDEYRLKDILSELLEVEIVPVEKDKDAWRNRFNDLYRLDKGEVLKRIAPPFIEERMTYYVTMDSDQAEAIPEGPDRMVFHWDGELNRWGQAFGNVGYLASMLSSVMHLKSFEFTGADEVLKTELAGDWIVRNEEPMEVKLKALEKILSEDVGHEIRFEKRQVEREVIVASGKFEYKPLESKYSDSVYMFLDKFEPDDGGGGGTADSVSEFLAALGDRVGLPVQDNTEKLSKTIIPYRHMRSAYLAKLKDPVEKRRKLELLFENISRQTGLKFRFDRVPVDVWFVIEDGKSDEPLEPVSFVQSIKNKMPETGIDDTGDIRYGEKIGVMLKSDDGLVACKSIEFKRDGGFVTAVVGMDVSSGPKAKWEVVLQLLDSQGNEVRAVAERFENSGKTSGVIFVGSQEITFTLGKFSEIKKAVRFKLSIVGADAVEIEARIYSWPADDETVDEFLRTEIFVDEDGKELSEDQISSGQFSADLSDDNVRQFKELIKQLPDAKLLTAPKVTVLDTEPARISVTKQRNYISGFSDNKDELADPEPIVETLDEGIRMELIPHITPDGKSIRLDVDLEMTDVGKWVERSYKNKYPYELPIINSTSMTTLVMIADQKWCLFDLGEMTSDKTADNSEKKSNRVVVFIKATKVNLSNDENSPRAKDTKNSYGKQSSVAVKIPDEKDENATPVNPATIDGSQEKITSSNDINAMVGTWELKGEESEYMCVYPDGRVEIFFADGQLEKSKLEGGKIEFSEARGFARIYFAEGSDDQMTVEFNNVKNYSMTFRVWRRLSHQPRPDVLDSLSKLYAAGQRVRTYALEHDSKLPINLMETTKGDPVKGYFSKENAWFDRNTDYLWAAGLRLSMWDPLLRELLVAYDRSLLERSRAGTTVLFLDGHVEFAHGEELAKLDIPREKIAIEMKIYLLPISEAAVIEIVGEHAVSAVRGEFESLGTLPGSISTHIVASQVTEDKLEQLEELAAELPGAMVFNASNLTGFSAAFSSMNTVKEFSYIHGYSEPDGLSKPEPKYETQKEGVEMHVFPVLKADGEHITIWPNLKVIDIVSETEYFYKNRKEYPYKLLTVETTTMETGITVSDGMPVVIYTGEFSPGVTKVDSYGNGTPLEGQQNNAKRMLVLVRATKIRAERKDAS